MFENGFQPQQFAYPSSRGTQSTGLGSSRSAYIIRSKRSPVNPKIGGWS